MRVLHLDNGRGMRGGQWQALALMRGLAQRGVEQRLLARDGSPLAMAAKAHELHVEPLSLRSAARNRRWADFAHAHDASSHTIAALAGLRPLVVARRVAFPLKSGMLSRWKYRRASICIAVSEYAKGRLVEGGVDPGRVQVVYDGVDLLEPAADRGVVVALASDDPGKCNDLIRSAASGGSFPIEFSDDLPKSLPGASVFLYLSREEGLGSAALLAMAAGVPVIASDIPALREVVADGETGILVDNEASVVSKAVQALLCDAPLRRRMGSAGRACVEKRFLTRHMVEATLNAYKSL